MGFISAIAIEAMVAVLIGWEKVIVRDLLTVTTIWRTCGAFSAACKVSAAGKVSVKNAVATSTDVRPRGRQSCLYHQATRPISLTLPPGHPPHQLNSQRIKRSTLKLSRLIGRPWSSSF